MITAPAFAANCIPHRAVILWMVLRNSAHRLCDAAGGVHHNVN